MASTGVERVTRGAAAAGVSTFVALLSHVAGGGIVPAVEGVAVPLVLSLALCTALAGRRLSLPRLMASVVVSQVLFHALFVLGSPTGITATDGTTTAAHVHSIVLDSTAAHGHTDGAGMWWAHALAALVTIVALRRGERATAHLLGVTRIVVVRLATARLDRARSIAPVVIESVTLPVASEHDRVDARRDQATASTRRGPPLAAAAV
ncbi:hypothetical protein ELQ90_02040 [Labedella phragmitis]|uniref:Uncharacterized protein n=1 Tax=Labedella phragmitis TaxID=2498849 RepID=A0A3S4BLH3_9MICO|nr:hypothetical protein [Labedella phragmitis]RWZ52747.1 hypothetical protein ELQ90_02040 [Labedella phragmitis]